MDAVNEDSLISFIIPHKGRFDMLQQTIQSIAEQNYPLNKIEVIVVSQTPEIKQASLIENEQLRLTVLLQDSSKTISALRNHGVSMAKGSYLAFLDADIFISPNWIHCMLSHLQEKQRAIVSAMQICEDSAPPLERIRTSLSNVDIDTDLAFLPGRNLFLTRHSFDCIGGFPEHLITCEDYYFTDKAAKLGSLYYTSDATYIHIGEDKSFSEMFKKEIWRGQSNLQSIKGRKIPLREIPSFILPLGICSLILTALISALFQAYPAALTLLLMAAIPLIAYSFRLYRIAKNVVGFASIVKFYATYFPARAIGTLVGLFKSINANHS